MDNKFDYIEPNNPMTFDEAWEHLDKLGFPVIRLSEEDYKMLSEHIDECKSMREIEEIFKNLE